MSGVEESDKFIDLITSTITKLTGVDPAFVDVTVDATAVSSCGGTRRKLLSGSKEFSYYIKTGPGDNGGVEGKMAGGTPEDYDTEFRNQAAEEGVDVGGATTESVQGITVTTATPAPTITAMPTGVPTPAPTATPSSDPTSSPTVGPTAVPTAGPTTSPAPTDGPTIAPTATASPTFAPTSAPSPPFWARQDQGRHFAAHDKPKGLHRSPASRSPGPTMIITLLSRRRRRTHVHGPHASL